MLWVCVVSIVTAAIGLDIRFEILHLFFFTVSKYWNYLNVLEKSYDYYQSDKNHGAGEESEVDWVELDVVED